MNNNQKTFLLIGAVILITVVLYSVMIYNFDYFRGLALNALLKKDGNNGIYAKQGSLLADIESSQATSSMPAASTATTTPPAEKVAAPTFGYKMTLDPDPCTLNKLGADGWEILQVSAADLDSVKGLDENCRRSGSFPALSWILFVKRQ